MVKILIVGAGSVGRLVANDMTQAGHEVTIVEIKPESLRAATVPGASWMLGDASDLSTLESAGAGLTDALVVTTGDDKANLVISLLAKTEFGVPRIIARVSNESNAWLFDEAWGVDVAVSTPRMMADIVEEALSPGRLMRRMRFQSGASLYQGTVTARSLMTERPVGQVSLPADIVIASVIRDGVPLSPSPDMSVEGGDQLLFVVGPHAEVDEISQLFR
ncbi:trk system potassium uptake protein TrkA [Trueperella bonasi]|uniref:Trk system potassium uptake protein TrkA n=1 Tax=Trueperella bonasi TaxID=312286 RepID=A0ABT9NIA0_9ACTO|nr:TrkA family potassium uptake protein [Trueperella bonasi]MDP9807131.1 trk system potassium uptake protein TrkA [Trueperella bonasi]